MIILGSASDYKVAEKAINVFEEMKIHYDLRVASAHRTHKRVKDIVRNETDEVEVIITIAGLAAHLPGVVASYTTKPVIAVEVMNFEPLRPCFKVNFSILSQFFMRPPASS